MTREESHNISRPQADPHTISHNDMSVNGFVQGFVHIDRTRMDTRQYLRFQVKSPSEAMAFCKKLSPGLASGHRRMDIGTTDRWFHTPFILTYYIINIE